jgi:hypothetical protein
MKERSFAEQLQKGLADAISDIREKVVEEPMWGRSMGDNSEPLKWSEAIEQRSFGSSERTVEREPDLDIER